VGERIEKIGAHGKIAIPTGARIIDGHGLYLMPGLVDAHVHYVDALVFGRLMIANGVLLVRDTGMKTETILRLRDSLNRGALLGPEMVATGTDLDGSPPIILIISIGLKTPEEGRQAVRRQAEAGVDMIKVYSRLDKEVFLAILNEAQMQGLKVIGHVPDSITIEDAAAAGLSSSEHFFGFEKALARLLGEPGKLVYAGMGSEAGLFERFDEVDQEALQTFYRRIRDSGMAVCPTVVTFKTGTRFQEIQSGSYPHPEYISQKVLDVWNSLWPDQDDLPDFIWQNWAKMVRGLNEVGVPLMVGTDLSVPGILPGYSVHEEMVIWQEAGIQRVLLQE
jgi:imidazolonepropionase-like amidohydrolase